MIGQNVARQILSMLKGQYINAITPFTLVRRQQILIGNALRESHLLMPIGLNGDVGGRILLLRSPILVTVYID